MSQLVAVLQLLVRQHARSVLLAFAGLALVAAAVAAATLRIDTSIGTMMIRNDPERIATRALTQEFSDDTVLVAAFDLGRPFVADDLRTLRRISRRVAAVAGVEEVLDLSNVEDVRDRDGELDASPLVDFAVLDEEAREIRERVRAHRLYRANLVSDDLETLALLVFFDPVAHLDDGAHETTSAVLAILAAEAGPWEMHAAGFPVNEHEANRIIRRDLLLLSPPVLVAVLIVVFLATRKSFALLLLLALVGWTEVVTLAWFGLSGTPIAVVTSAVPAILLATSSTYAIYLLGLLAAVSRGPEPGVTVIALATRPALLSAVSTAIGFLSLRFFEVQVIQELGWSLTMGIVAAAIGALLLLPALVHRFDLRLDPVRLRGLERLSVACLRVARRPQVTLAVTAVLAALALPGIGRIAIDSDPLQYFHPESAQRRADRFVRERISGTGVVNVVVRTARPDAALAPPVLAFAEELRARIERSPIVDRTISLLDYLYLMDVAMRPGEEPGSVLERPGLAAQYLLLYEAGGDPGDYRHYVNHDRSALNILVRANTVGSTHILALHETIERVGASAPAAVTEVRGLGSLYLLAKGLDRITRGVIVGLAVALALIIVVVALGLRSLTLALVAVLPCGLPVLWCAGFLGWAGLPLSVGTSIVGCIALGLAVDDTAHVLGHLRRGRPLEEVYRIVGAPIILTSVSLGLGFSVLALSEFQPIMILGVATALTLSLALICNLLILPALLVLIGYPVYADDDDRVPVAELVPSLETPVGAE